MRSLFNRIKNCFKNIGVLIIGLFYKRDKHIWIFGSWMGQRFADNSRFLYQYLYDNKSKYNLSRVVWVTDDEQVFKELKKLNYDVVYKSSDEGKKLHLKAGVHVVCNMPYSGRGYNGDLNGSLSAGAKKIQLWHGVGIKAVNKLRDNNSKHGLIGFLKGILMSRCLFGSAIFSPGCWDNRYQLCTGRENARVAVSDMGARKDRIIIANYPRLSEYGNLLSSEEKEIELFLDKIKGKKVILYLPTFREKSNILNQIRPIDNEDFCKYLEDNELIWVEKQHFSSNLVAQQYNQPFIYFIDSKFDINLIYKYIDLLITDYSSASSDCIFRGIKVLSYIPDRNIYKSSERAFVNKYEYYYPCLQAEDINTLKVFIDEYLEDNKKFPLENEYKKCRDFLFEGNSCDIEWITERIMDNIHYLSN